MHLWRPAYWITTFRVVGCKNVTRALMNADTTSPGKRQLKISKVTRPRHAHKSQWPESIC